MAASRNKIAELPSICQRAENETRTRDPNLGKVVLYQLSYCRICYFFQIASFLKAVAKVALFLETTVFETAVSETLVSNAKVLRIIEYQIVCCLI